MTGMRECESAEERTGRPCPSQAAWVIGVGTRKADEQAACGRHLHRAATAMYEAEGRPGVTLTLRRQP